MNIKYPLSHRSKEPERSVLYIVGTPIGNLDDISIRSINILKKVSLIACEDTRNTGKLLKYLNISNKLISFNQHNASKRVNFLLSQLEKGYSLALVSDAGMPLISDPGEIIVQKAREHNFDVICIPGPCAAILALVSSGIDTSKFTFYGFLPKKSNEKNIIMNEISKSSKTSIIYESPKRILKLLIELKSICGGDRKVAVLKEMTKRYETYFGDNIDNVIKQINNNEEKGEFTMIISGSNKDNHENLMSKEDLIIDLQDLIKAGLSHSAASNYLSKKSGYPRNQIYKLITKK